MKNAVLISLFLISLSPQGELTLAAANESENKSTQDCVEALREVSSTEELIKKHEPEKIAHIESPLKVFFRSMMELFTLDPPKKNNTFGGEARTPFENEIYIDDNFERSNLGTHWSKKQKTYDFQFTEWKPKSSNKPLNQLAADDITNELSNTALHLAMGNLTSLTDVKSRLERYSESQSSSFFAGSSSLSQNVSAINSFRSKVEMRQVDFNSIDELFAQLNSEIQNSSSTALQKLNTLSEILELYARGTDSGKKTLNTLNSINSQIPKLYSTPETVGRVVMNHLPGTLSQRYLQSLYNKNENFDWDGFMNGLKKNQLTEIVIALKSKAITSLLLHQREEAEPSNRSFIPGANVPINDREFHFEVATSLDEYEYFHRGDGISPKYDMIRLLAGDMQKRTYYDTIQDQRILQIVPVVDTAFLADHSGSMDEHNKYRFRNAMICAYLEKAATEIIQGIAKHIIRYIPFGTNVMTEHIIVARNLEEISALYMKLMNNEIPNPGATNITDAWLTAVDSIVLELQNGSGTTHANIVTVTDGIDEQFNPAKITQKISQIPGHIQIGRNVINFEIPNHGLRSMVEQQLTSHEASHYSPYQFFSLQDLNNLGNGKQFISEAETVAAEITLKPESIQKVKPDSLDALRRNILELMVHREKEIEEGNSTYSELELLLFELEDGPADPELDDFVTRFHTYKDSVLFQSFLPSEKALFIKKFLSLIAFRYDLTPEQLVKKMSLKTRSKVREMLTDKGLL